MRGVAAALALLAGACAREPAPTPAPAASPSAEVGVLRPLTSRDHHGVEAATSPTAGPAISGRVELAQSLAGRSGAALFVIARRTDTQQIVAVRKEEAQPFPIAFSISGADAMVEGTSFEGPLDLTARLSLSGDAAPARGDVEGVVRALAPGARDVRIVLDSVRQ